MSKKINTISEAQIAEETYKQKMEIVRQERENLEKQRKVLEDLEKAEILKAEKVIAKKKEEFNDECSLRLRAIEKKEKEASEIDKLREKLSKEVQEVTDAHANLAKMKIDLETRLKHADESKKHYLEEHNKSKLLNEQYETKLEEVENIRQQHEKKLKELCNSRQ